MVSELPKPGTVEYKLINLMSEIRVLPTIFHAHLQETRGKNVDPFKRTTSQYTSYFDELAARIDKCIKIMKQQQASFESCYKLKVALTSGVSSPTDYVFESYVELESFLESCKPSEDESKQSAGLLPNDPPMTMNALYKLCVKKMNRVGQPVAGSESTVRGWKQAKGFPKDNMTWQSIRRWLNEHKDFDIGEPPPEC